MLLILSKVVIFAKKTNVEQSSANLLHLQEAQLNRQPQYNLMINNRRGRNLRDADYRARQSLINGALNVNNSTNNNPNNLNLNNVLDPLILTSAATILDRPPSYTEIINLQSDLCEPPPPYTSTECLNDNNNVVNNDNNDNNNERN